MELLLAIALSTAGVAAGGVAWLRRHPRDHAAVTLRPVVGRTLGPAFRADPSSQGDVVARAPRVDAEPRTLGELVDALRAAGILHEVRRREVRLFTVAGERRAALIRVKNPRAISTVSLIFLTRDTPLTIAVTLALVPRFGPQLLRGPLIDVLVDGTRSLPELLEDANTHLRAELDAIQERLSAGQAVLDEFMARTRRK